MGGNIPTEFLTQWKQIISEMLIIHNPGSIENKIMAEEHTNQKWTTKQFWFESKEACLTAK